MMNLTPPASVQKLQETLHAKAKKAPDYRFYALYDKVYRADVLAHAYLCSQANGGTAGVDGQTFADIEAYGVGRWLGEVAEELRQKTYQPQALLRAWMPKADGGQRPLGIPTIKDRVVQTAVLLVLDPIFEADLQPEQYAYRPERGALDAVERVEALLKSGHTEVVDADLSGYFDSIPHAELKRCLTRRISDRHMLALLVRWLELPVEESDERGTRHRTNRAKKEGRGTPQGAPISPLLGNLYMRRFLLGWKTLGHAKRLVSEIVNYADDFVICSCGHGREAMAAMRDMMAKLKLTVNETKTRLCRVPEDTFNFLGYSFGRRYLPKTGRAFIGIYPSKRSVHKLCGVISDLTTRKWAWLDVPDQIKRLNSRLRGWAEYFRLGWVSAPYQAVKRHVCYRLRQWLGSKYAKRIWAAHYPDSYLHDTLGLIDLAQVHKARRISCANA
jgi:group II intron reverse transcriptase/maturase